MVTCSAADLGSRLQVEAGGPVAEGSVEKTYDPQPVLRPTRHPKKRYTQTFVPLKLGQIRLETGRVRVNLKAVDKPGERVCDLKSLWLRRVD